MLVQDIGQKGDALSAVKLDALDPHTEAYIPFDEEVAPSWSLLYALISKIENAPEKGKEIARAVPLFPLYFLVDAPHFLLRVVLFPLVLGLWWLEKRWAMWRG